MTEIEQKAQALQTKLDALKDVPSELKTAQNEIDALKQKNTDLLALIGEKKEGDESTIEQKFATINDEFKKLQEVIEEQKAAKENEVKSLGDAILDLEKKNSDLDKIAKEIKSGNGTINKTIELKASVLSTALTGTRQISMLEPGVDKPIPRMAFMRNIIPNVATNSPLIYWTERTAHTDGTGGVAEGNAAGESSSTWEEKSRKVVKRGVFFKYSNEAFEDMPQLIADLRADVERDLELDIDTQILSGDGSGTNFYGITADATAFNSTAIDVKAKVVNPNLADLIKCCATQIEIAHRMPTHVALNPVDFNKLELEKDPTTSQYVLPPFKTASGTEIAGVTVVKNTGVTKNTLIMFDRTAIRFYTRRDVQLQIWDQNEDDAKKDMKTVTLWYRAQVRVRENDKAGIVKVTDIAAALVDMKKA